MPEPTPRQILDVSMGENDADAATIRDYLIKLLAKVWQEGEGFDGKRPFGNSGWDGELAIALVRAGFVEGEIDEDGYLDGADYGRVESLVLAAIKSLGTADEASLLAVAVIWNGEDKQVPYRAGWFVCDLFAAACDAFNLSATTRVRVGLFNGDGVELNEDGPLSGLIEPLVLRDRIVRA